MVGSNIANILYPGLGGDLPNGRQPQGPGVMP
jgi:hypothetical protein